MALKLVGRDVQIQYIEERVYANGDRPYLELFTTCVLNNTPHLTAKVGLDH